MPRFTKHQVPSEMQEMLLNGRTFAEISEATGLPYGVVHGLHKGRFKHIDREAAIQRRVANPPNRLMADRDWCLWFSGLVDGDGHLCASFPKAQTLRVSLDVCLAHNAWPMMSEFARELGIGKVYKIKRARAYHFVVFRTADVAEVIIPLFDSCPLHLKALEYPLWREMAMMRYDNWLHRTAVGFTTYTEEACRKFTGLCQQLHFIRHSL